MRSLKLGWKWCIFYQVLPRRAAATKKAKVVQTDSHEDEDEDDDEVSVPVAKKGNPKKTASQPEDDDDFEEHPVPPPKKVRENGFFKKYSFAFWEPFVFFKHNKNCYCEFIIYTIYCKFINQWVSTKIPLFKFSNECKFECSRGSRFPNLNIFKRVHYIVLLHYNDWVTFVHRHIRLCLCHNLKMKLIVRLLKFLSIL